MADINFPSEFTKYIQFDGYKTKGVSGVTELQMDSGKVQRYLVNTNPLQETTMKMWMPRAQYLRFMDWYNQTIQRVRSFNMDLPTKGRVEAFISGNVDDRPLNQTATYYEVPLLLKWIPLPLDTMITSNFSLPFASNYVIWKSVTAE